MVAHKTWFAAVPVFAAFAWSIAQIGEDSSKAVQVTTDASSRTAIFDEAAEVMLRPDREVYLAEVCAQRRGAPNAPKPAPAGRVSVADPAEIRDGYGILAGSDNQETTLEDASRRRSRMESRHRQCVVDNARESRAKALAADYGMIMDAVVEDVQRDPVLINAEAEWRGCMGNAGFPFESRPEIVRSLIAEQEELGYHPATSDDVASFDAAIAALRARELAIATTDADCYARFVQDVEAEATETALNRLSEDSLAVLREAASLDD